MAKTRLGHRERQVLTDLLHTYGEALPVADPQATSLLKRGFIEVEYTLYGEDAPPHGVKDYYKLTRAGYLALHPEAAS